VNSLVRHADRGKIACLATARQRDCAHHDNAMGLYRQTIYYLPLGLQYARGRGSGSAGRSSTYDVKGIDKVRMWTFLEFNHEDEAFRCFS